MPSRETFAYRRAAQLRALRATESTNTGVETIYGKAAVRGSFISNTEKDMKRLVKKGEAHAREKFDMALATPEYMLLVQRLDLDEQHLRVMLMHAMKKVTGKYRMPELSHG